MRAIILAAGLGSRLRPVTNKTPKCLVLIHGRPLLGIWLENLTKSGVGPFLINTHYLHLQVEKYIRNSPYSSQVKLAYEPILLGTAGTLINNLSFFEGEDGILLHADNYCTEDMVDFIKAHQSRPPYCVMTMMIFRTKKPSACGIVQINAEKVVIDFQEKPKVPLGNLANGAIYILSKEMLATLLLGSKNLSDFSTEIISKFLGKIYTYETRRELIDIGTPETYKIANAT